MTGIGGASAAGGFVPLHSAHSLSPANESHRASDAEGRPSRGRGELVIELHGDAGVEVRAARAGA